MKWLFAPGWSKDAPLQRLSYSDLESKLEHRFATAHSAELLWQARHRKEDVFTRKRERKYI